MASNFGKVGKWAGGIWDKATDFTKKNPVISGVASVLSIANPLVTAPTIAGQFKDKKGAKKTEDPKKPKTTYNSPLAGNINYYDDTAESESSGGGGGGYGYSGPDISGLLAAYDQQAAASRSIAQNAYDTTRNDLLTSLKRFQEQNAKDVANQKQSYLSEQSSLDYAREQANRQNRVAASARGLGGSGLQQLAQLQTLMGQSEDISQAALSNQKAMDALKQALQQKEDDTNTSLAKAQTTLDDALSKIEANLAQQKAEAILSSQSGGGYSGGGGSSSADYDTSFDAGLAGLLESFNNELQGYAGKTDKQVKNAVNAKYGTSAKTMNDVRTILGQNFIDLVGSNASGASKNAYNNAMAQTKAMVANLKGQGKTTKKTTEKATKKATKKTTKKKK